MAVQIDSELLEFKDKVSGSIGSMRSTITTLVEMFKTVETANSNAKEEISSCYKTPNSEAALSSFDSLNSSIESASSAINDKVTAVLAKCEDLITKIEHLIQLKNEIDEAEKKIKDAQAKLAGLQADDPQIASLNQIISDNTKIVQEKTKEFNVSHAAAKTLLASLKATDGTAPTIG